MRTLTVKKNGGGGAFNSGWNQAKIIKAEYDSWNDKKVLDIWFEGFPETLNMRVYEAVNADGEEFAIGQIFRFANAGIIEGLESDDGNVVIKMSDEASELEGKYLNIYLYKDGKYFRVLSSAAPTSFENAVDKFSEEDVTFWKGKALAFFSKYVEPKIDSTGGSAIPEEQQQEMPY